MKIYTNDEKLSNSEGEARVAFVVVTCGWSCGVATHRSPPRVVWDSTSPRLESNAVIDGGTTSVRYPSVGITIRCALYTIIWGDYHRVVSLSGILHRSYRRRSSVGRPNSVLLG